MNKLVYLAAPYSHTDPAEMVKRAWMINRATGYLLSHKGETHSIYSPISHGTAIEPHLHSCCATNHAWWLNQCKPVVMACDEFWLLCLPGWSESSGVLQELRWCAERNLQVTQIEPDFIGPPNDIGSCLRAPMHAAHVISRIERIRAEAAR